MAVNEHKQYDNDYNRVVLGTKNCYESDEGETEDEEVKRNCIMGQSGMRDSDFSDSESEDDVEDEDYKVGKDAEDDDNHSDNNGKDENNFKDEEEPRMEGLVEFVSFGGQIPKSKEGILYRPAPIRNALIPVCKEEKEEAEEEEYCETLNDLEENSDHSTSKDAKNTIIPDSETEISGGSSSSDNSLDTASIESDEQIMMVSTSTDFSFFEITTASGTEESYDSSEEDHHEPEIVNGNFAIVGASGASVDDIKWQQMVKQKRVLSSNTLSILNQEADHHIDSTKKMRCSHSHNMDRKSMISIPDFTLGIEALDQIIQPLPRQYQIREDSFSLIPSSSSDEEDDMMLSEELEEKFRSSTNLGGNNSPIPLLTPPQSPQTVGDDTEIATTIMTTIEWPSNLVMDSAVMKVSNLSPITLDNNVDKDGEEKWMKDQRSYDVEKPSTSCLTPLLRSIYVGNI